MLSCSEWQLTQKSGEECARLDNIEVVRVAGDVAMLATEVAPVLKGLRKNGLDVVAVHHHLLTPAHNLLPRECGVEEATCDL